MKYIEYINSLIKEKVKTADNLVVFGQNISAGSCLGGLTRGLQIKEGGMIINTPNIENSLCGVGFGLMLQGVNSIYFMKQQDFLLLGIDQLANTYNFIRRKNPSASFTIFPIIVDSGYQGLQSSLNNFADFCSIARISGFAITNETDAKEIINSHLVSPGFRIIGASQRLFGQELLVPETVSCNESKTIFRYSEGKDATVVCFNFSFPYGWELQKSIMERGGKASLFSVNSLTPVPWDEIIKSACETKKLVVIDDSKSENLSAYKLMQDILSECKLDEKIFIQKDMSGDWLSPNPDALSINYEEMAERLIK